MNGRGDHSSDDRRGDGLHHIGTDAGLPQDWSQTENHGSHRHQFGTQALNRAFDGLDPAKNGLRGLPSQG